jgi:hypothetical protein
MTAKIHSAAMDRAGQASVGESSKELPEAPSIGFHIRDLDG